MGKMITIPLDEYKALKLAAEDLAELKLPRSRLIFPFLSVDLAIS